MSTAHGWRARVVRVVQRATNPEWCVRTRKMLRRRGRPTTHLEMASDMLTLASSTRDSKGKGSMIDISNVDYLPYILEVGTYR